MEEEKKKKKKKKKKNMIRWFLLESKHYKLKSAVVVYTLLKLFECWLQTI